MVLVKKAQLNVAVFFRTTPVPFDARQTAARAFGERVADAFAAQFAAQLDALNKRLHEGVPESEVRSRSQAHIPTNTYNPS